MKSSSVVVAIVAFFAHVAAGTSLSPISRVVELLQGLSKKVEEEGKKEESLYEKFVCWGNEVIKAKQASNADSESRIQSLNTYIADIDAGRIEFTSERTDLEKELEQLNGDLEAAKAMREKENSDYLEAKDEMEKAIAALDEAIDVLGTATANHTNGTLLALKSSVRAGFETFAERTAETQRLDHAVQLAERFLTKGDAFFLKRLLVGGGDVPTADWKKLNRKATYKMSYKARSFKIQDVLAKMHQTFTANLAEAMAKESNAVALYQELKTAKEGQKTAAEDALLRMEKESGAAGMSRADAAEEVALLQQQVTDDTAYIAQVQQELATKKTEWQARSVLRAGELEAISKAISILNSDDARDLFKKSLASQGYSFLQLSKGSERRELSAAKLLAKASAGDKRMTELAARLRSRGNFDAVVSAIDNMVSTLQAEEASDLATKETCETDRMTDTRTAAVTSRTMDDHTDTITRLESEIAEIESEIVDKQKQSEAAQAELDEATRMRADENAAYLVAKKDDEDAVALVESTIGVLTQFYADNGLMLSQQGKQPVVGPVVAGEAPPPPPTTWEAPYGGKTEESTGIISALTMIKEDMEQDIAKATAAETESLNEFNALSTDLTQQMNDLASMISTLQGTKATKEGEVETTKGERATAYGQLEVVMQKIKDAEPTCFYFTINYAVRAKNRQIEIDGLLKAKAILLGGEFATPEDPNREMKPGDALVQVARPHRFLASARQP